jgi:hypothetical protein
MPWARMLAYVTGKVNQELLLRNEYLAAENHILKAQIKGRLLLSEAEKSHIGRDRPPAGTEGFGGSGVHRSTRYDSGLVSEAYRKQIRWIEVSPASGSTQGR